MGSSRPRLSRWDWLLLIASLMSGGGGGYLALWMGTHLLLEPQIVEETALRLSKQVQLVEKVLEGAGPQALPEGVLVQSQGQLDSRQPRWRNQAQARFDRRVQEAISRELGLPRQLQRDQAPAQDVWGGHWVRLGSPRSAEQGGSLRLYQSERLSNSLWYLPLLRIMAILIGVLAGLVLFLRLKVERPLTRLLQQFGKRGATAPPPLLPEAGITLIRQLSLHINRLLERINNTARARRELLQGLTHDLACPHGRLMLRTELLCEQLKGDQRQLALAMARDLEQVRGITEQLALLGEQELPPAECQTCSLDDLCGRIAASQPAGLVQLRVPRMLVHLNPEGLERALNNLIDIALEHGAPPVRPSARRRGRDLLLRMDDRGADRPTDTVLAMQGPNRSNDRSGSATEAWTGDRGAVLSGPPGTPAAPEGSGWRSAGRTAAAGGASTRNVNPFTFLA